MNPEVTLGANQSRTHRVIGHIMSVSITGKPRKRQSESARDIPVLRAGRPVPVFQNLSKPICLGYQSPGNTAFSFALWEGLIIKVKTATALY